MKKLLLLLFFTPAVNFLFAQSDTTNPIVSIGNSTKTNDTLAMAKIYVIRSTGHIGSAVNLRILVNDMMFCKIKNNRYALFYVKPGTHMFNATTWDKPGTPEKFALKMPVVAGGTYYLSLKIKQRFMGIEVLVEEVTNNTAAPLLQKYTHDACE